MPDRYGEDQVSGVRLMVTILRRRRLILVMALIVGGAVAVFTLLQPRTYTARAAFAPESGASAQSSLMGLAAEFGFRLPTGESAESPEFYAALVTSRDVLETLAAQTYPVVGDGDTTWVEPADLLRVEEENPALRHDEVIKELGDRVTATVDRQTGLVRATVRTESRSASLHMAREVLELINAFNLEQRQSEASAEAAFVEGRLEIAWGELRRAEDELQQFMERNRNFSEASPLQFEYDRLTRTVANRQEIATSLEQAYEQARIEQVRNTPVISVVEGPYATQIPDRRRLVLKTLFGLLVGGTLAAILVVSGAVADVRRASQPGEFQELDEVREDILRGVRRLARLSRSSDG